jgi:predicted protein tyrosine phosphatase
MALMNILFVCSRNQWRSPTAESIYKNRNGIKAKSAGTEPSARIRLTSNLIKWADLIFVMERKHKERMIGKFPDETKTKSIIILDIEDEYKYMDKELIEEIVAKVESHIGK